MAKDSQRFPPLYTSGDVARRSGAAPVNGDREQGWGPFNKDYARLVHAPSFRRLQGKTQLLPGIEDDFFRNRLTHSKEVAQIAAGIARSINSQLQARGIEEQVDVALVEFAALAHDLGHPPFGHNGEAALDKLMLPYGGFEGNAQTLHILASVEAKLVTTGTGQRSSAFGLDLTYRTLASILKYDKLIEPKRKGGDVVKGYYEEEADLVKRIKRAVAPGSKGKFKTLECSIMDIADDIAYSTYDLEDTLHARFVTPAELLGALFHDKAVRAAVLDKTNKTLKKAKLKVIQSDTELFETAIKVIPSPKIEHDPALESLRSSLSLPAQAALDAIAICKSDSRMVNDEVLRTAFTAERVGILLNGLELTLNPQHPALSQVALVRDKLINVELFKHLNFELVIRAPRLAITEQRGKGIVERVFNQLVATDGELLLPNWRDRYKKATTKHARMRIVCDFVAGMTDRYAVEMHDALLGAGKTIYKPH
jgi:dGTPase